MAFPINGDILPVSSGFANLGVGVDGNGQDAFDASAIRPFNHVHQVSGVFHDPLHGQSGVLRFNQEQGAFQVSVDGGLTFVNLSAGGVDSVGVIGGANITGNVDFASASSGFIAITDTAGASPVFWAVDHLGLSGLWDFPTQGFNGSVVNELTDFNGTTVQGSVLVQGVSGIIADIVGQTLTIGPANALPRCYAATFSASPTTTISHNLNSSNVMVQFFNDGTPRLQLLPDLVSISDANTVGVRFNTNQDGLVVIMACD